VSNDRFGFEAAAACADSADVDTDTKSLLVFPPVRALGTGGNTNSDFVQATTGSDQTAASKPNLSSNTVTTTSTLLTWGEVTNESGFEVYQGINKIADLAADVVDYSATGLTASTAYVFYVRSLGAGGNTNSDFVPVTTAAEPAQVAASKPNLLFDTVTTTSARLTWGDVSDETGFEVYQGITKIADLAADVVDYSATGLTASTAYVFYVRSLGAGGNTNSDFVPVTTAAEPAQAAAASKPNLLFDTVTTTSARLIWGDVSDNIGFDGRTGVASVVTGTKSLFTFPSRLSALM